MQTPISDDKRQRKKNRQSLLKRFNQLLSRGPRNREQLVQQLRTSKQRKLLDAQALKMIEGVLQISDRHVRDIMIPRAKITVISDTTSLPELLPIVIDSGHSRFPVIGNSNKEVIGLLLAKDLLKYNPLVHSQQLDFRQGAAKTKPPEGIKIHEDGKLSGNTAEDSSAQSAHQDNFNIRDIIRPAVFIPESKRLDSLLEEFQHKHYHMAIVVDEYGAVSGLVTIEDVLEEIVGEIEDEYDDNEEVFVQKQTEHQFLVKALMPIEAFNHYFSSDFTTEQFDTIGGFIANRFGYLPKRGASITLAPLHFKVLRADNRQIRLLQVTNAVDT
ncbi:Mg2+/Co2+ transporter [Candidatus Rickettsiella viridis]|uniref:Magnesium and cobalt efflux protein CorC n=1 Tax=Candidatus Rickettsiella viridis TaxID=676208 RepID=A0A2Z5UVC4_9COXI|nr:transporter associated domain-containing protein [Candidatus Rickettsiella viridis]BBB15015.1 Mg2+/Co2+ transporter [Candidatus Rickettsiella viridis]